MKKNLCMGLSLGNSIKPFGGGAGSGNYFNVLEFSNGKTGWWGSLDSKGRVLLNFPDSKARICVGEECTF